MPRKSTGHTTPWRMLDSFVVRLPASAMLHEIALHGGHARGPVGCRLGAAGLGRPRSLELGPRSRRDSFAQVLVNVGTGEAEAAANRRVGVLGINGSGELRDFDQAVKCVEIGHGTRGRRTKTGLCPELIAPRDARKSPKSGCRPAGRRLRSAGSGRRSVPDRGQTLYSWNGWKSKRQSDEREHAKRYRSDAAPIVDLSGRVRVNSAPAAPARRLLDSSCRRGACHRFVRRRERRAWLETLR